MTEREYDFWRGWRAAESDDGASMPAIDQKDCDFADGYVTCLEWHGEGGTNVSYTV